MSDVRMDPFRTFNFRLEIDNTTVAAFSDVSGLTSTGEVASYRTGVDIPLTTRKLPGLRSYGPITLKRGVIADATLWDWYRNISTGQADRRNGSVILMNEAREDVMRWNFENAWPNKIEGPTLKLPATRLPSRASSSSWKTSHSRWPESCHGSAPLGSTTRALMRARHR